MTRILAVSALAVSVLAGATAAKAQSYMAPAGIPESTAPGYAAGSDLGRSLSAVSPRGYQSLPAASTVRHQGRTYRR